MENIPTLTYSLYSNCFIIVVSKYKQSPPTYSHQAWIWRIWLEMISNVYWEIIFEIGFCRLPPFGRSLEPQIPMEFKRIFEKKSNLKKKKVFQSKKVKHCYCGKYFLLLFNKLFKKIQRWSLEKWNFKNFAR